MTTPKEFEKEIAHLTQEEVLTGSIAVLNKILVDKGVITNEELQQYFRDWLNFKFK